MNRTTSNRFYIVVYKARLHQESLDNTKMYSQGFLLIYKLHSDLEFIMLIIYVTTEAFTLFQHSYHVLNIIILNYFNSFIVIVLRPLVL